VWSSTDSSTLLICALLLPEARKLRGLQPFSQKSLTATVPKVFQIGLCGVVVADLELFCNSWSVGFLGERLYAACHGCSNGEFGLDHSYALPGEAHDDVGQPIAPSSQGCLPRLQPFSQKSRTPTVAKEFQIGLYDPAEADLELFCNSRSAGFLGERLYLAEDKLPNLRQICMNILAPVRPRRQGGSQEPNCVTWCNSAIEQVSHLLQE